MNNIKEYFTNIYLRNQWGGKESRSGKGSDLENTAVIRSELIKLINELKIENILDAPCGDVNWISLIWNSLKIKKYIGADIVSELITKNNSCYANNNPYIISFNCIDIIQDNIPNVDLILSRDCLVHFSYKTIQRILNNFINSRSTYLLMTHFTDKEIRKYPDINDGNWRAINFQLPPWNFSDPIYIINEQCNEDNYKWTDKSLALWKLEDLKGKI